MAALNNPLVDFLSLDLNGNESAVLETLNWTSLNISAMSVEMSNINNKKDIYMLLEQKSFSYVKSAGFSDIFLTKKA